MASSAQQAKAFVAQLKAGAIALHPSDTVPGLTCWPSQLAALAAFKGRRADQSFIFLAGSMAAAQGLWQPLPAGWPEALASLWPGPLTAIYSSSAAGLALQNGASLALRVPALPCAARWYLKVLAETPLPSTSANATGEPAATTWPEAVQAFAGHPEVYIPPLEPQAARPAKFSRAAGEASRAADGAASEASRPSTLIRIEGPRSFALLRAGAMPQEAIHAALNPDH